MHLSRSSSSSLVLPEKPAALEFTDKQSLTLIITTYQKNDNARHSGSVYKLHGNKIAKHTPLPGGIFRFIRRQSDGHIITALTTGSIGIVDDDLNCVQTIPVSEEGIPLLSVSLHENSLLCSDAYGRLHIIGLETGNIVLSFLSHLSPYTKEPCEVWTTAWLSGNCVLSGAEDNLLKLWDLRADTKQPVGVNREHHCGVISLHREENSEHNVISGSYDDHLRRIDLRNFTQSLLEKKMNGGVWNVQDASDNSYMVSCMYGGWALVEKGNFDILQANEEIGENLLYGADFSQQADVVVSCTFNNYSVNFEAL